jgi:hypothetical protein
VVVAVPGAARVGAGSTRLGSSWDLGGTEGGTAGGTWVRRFGHVATAHRAADRRRSEERATLAWARRLIRAGSAAGAPPRFGSSEWAALPDTDRRKVAAAVIAALCWWDDGRPSRIASRLRDELDARALAEEQLDAEEFAALATRVRRMANSPSHAELTRRRAELRDVIIVDGRPVSVPRTRPDYPGRLAAGGPARSAVPDGSVPAGGAPPSRARNDSSRSVDARSAPGR